VALPTTTLYTSYLLRVCATRPHAEGLAALLPCFWVYMHVSTTTPPPPSARARAGWSVLFLGATLGMVSAQPPSQIRDVVAP
jgi:hypothetical protein